MTTENRRSQTHTSRKVDGGGLAERMVTMSSDDMWKYKRECQRADIEGLKSGAISANDVSWFSGGVARNAKLVGSLF